MWGVGCGVCGQEGEAGEEVGCCVSLRVTADLVLAEEGEVFRERALLEPRLHVGAVGAAGAVGRHGEEGDSAVMVARLGIDPLGDVVGRLVARAHLEPHLLEVIDGHVGKDVEVNLVLGEGGRVAASSQRGGKESPCESNGKARPASAREGFGGVVGRGRQLMVRCGASRGSVFVRALGKAALLEPRLGVRALLPHTRSTSGCWWEVVPCVCSCGRRAGGTPPRASLPKL